MADVRQTESFARWLTRLRDRRARARILARIDRLAIGNPGDVKPVGGGISEMRIDYGPGYRVYFIERGTALVILLAGGDKRTQVVHDVDACTDPAIIEELMGAETYASFGPDELSEARNRGYKRGGCCVAAD